MFLTPQSVPHPSAVATRLLRRALPPAQGGNDGGGRLLEALLTQVRGSLAEDFGVTPESNPGQWPQADVTAALLPETDWRTATLWCREPAVLAGAAWFEAVFVLLSPAHPVEIQWLAGDGDRLAAGEPVCRLRGPVRTLLAGERTALNWLQTLSGVATTTAAYVAALAGLGTQVLDTRKTLPGLRLAQKYAVAVGGGSNHRLGLYDALLVKENHIAACGGIEPALQLALEQAAGLPVIVEVEQLEQLERALTYPLARILLDNFDLHGLTAAVAMRDHFAQGLNQARMPLEASGGACLDTLRAMAETGVDYISVGRLTKDVRAIDLSLRLDD